MDDNKQTERKMKKETFDVVFNDNWDSNNVGVHGTIEDCESYINTRNGDKSSYFGDYEGGTVSIVSDLTGITVEEWRIKDGKCENL